MGSKYPSLSGLKDRNPETQVSRSVNLSGADTSRKRGFTFCRRRVSLRGKIVLFISAVWMLTLALGTTLAAQVPTPANHAQKASSPAAEGQRSFESHCASCHGLDGRG